MQNIITGIQHLGLPTNDLEATIAFYETLGFAVAHQTTIVGEDVRVAFLRLKDVVIEAYENCQAALCHGAWDHVALNVTDIEAAYAFAKEKGFPLVDEEIRFLPFWEKGVKFFSILGPNQEKVEFNQYL